MKVTCYFTATRARPDRMGIEVGWIEQAVLHPQRVMQQADGRWRYWACVAEAGGRWLRMVLLEDAETVHNAFFDRDFLP